MVQEDFKKILLAKHIECPSCPSNDQIIDFFEGVLGLLFPNLAHKKLTSSSEMEALIDSLNESLKNMLVHFPGLCETSPKETAAAFFTQLKTVETLLNKDIEAIYEGDPAAKSTYEIVRSYPGFYAIATYRIAHLLHQIGVSVIPRIITEHAHHRTGIDIHPAATIDHSFCIDHGTGVVIGETATIGHHVKLYQGVTLGALSVDKADADIKRHPTIEPNVVIYANTTILGGDTVIGKQSIIGGNVWITKSVPPKSTVYYIAGDNQIQKTK